MPPKIKKPEKKASIPHTTLPSTYYFPDGKTKLTAAASQGNTTSIRKLLDKKHDINGFDRNGHTALMIAAQEGHLHTVRFLLKENANINLRVGLNEFGIMSLAFISHSSAMIALLIENGVTLLGQDFLAGLMFGYENIVSSLSQNGRVEINSLNGQNATVLYDAVESYASQERKSPGLGLKMVETLLQHKADPNISRCHEHTPYLFATRLNHTALANLFLAHASKKPTLENFIDAIISKNLGWVTYCLEVGAVTINQLFIHESEELSPLMLAVGLECEAIVHYLIQQHNADVNLKNSLGYTALSYSISDTSDITFPRILLDNGSDPTIRDAKGIPIFWTAAQRVNPDILQYLLSHHKGEPLDLNESINDQSLLMDAVDSKNGVMVEFLLSQPNSQCDIPDSYGDTPLMCAAFKGNYPVFCMLANKGAQLDKKNNLDITALGYAAKRGHLTIVSELIRRFGSEPRGLDAINAQDALGQSALALAASLGHCVIVDFLLKNGAAIDAPEKLMGWTPLMFAIDNENIAVVKLLVQSNASLRLTDKTGQNAKEMAHTMQNKEIINFLEQYELLQLLNSTYPGLDIPERLVVLLHQSGYMITIDAAQLRIQKNMESKSFLIFNREMFNTLCQLSMGRSANKLYNTFITELWSRQTQLTDSYMQDQVPKQQPVIDQLKAAIETHHQIFINSKQEVIKRIVLSQEYLTSSGCKIEDRKKQSLIKSNMTKKLALEENIRVLNEKIDSWSEIASALSQPLSNLEECHLIIQQGHTLLTNLSDSIVYSETLELTLDDQLQFEQNSIEAWKKKQQKASLLQAPTDEKYAQLETITPARRSQDQPKSTVKPSQIRLIKENVVAESKSEMKSSFVSTAPVVIHKPKVALPDSFFHFPKPRETTLEDSCKITAALESYDCLRQTRQVLHQTMQSIQSMQCMQFDDVYSQILLKNALLGCCAQMMEKFKRFDNGLNPFTSEMARKFRNACYHAPELFGRPDSMGQLFAMTIELVEYAINSTKNSNNLSKPKVDIITIELWHTIQNHVINQDLTVQDCHQQLSIGMAELDIIRELPDYKNLMVQKATEFIIAKLGVFSANMRELHPEEYVIYKRFLKPYIEQGAKIRHGESGYGLFQIQASTTNTSSPANTSFTL